MLALARFLNLAWDCLMPSQNFKHYTCSTEIPGFWPLEGKTTAGFDAWAGSEKTIAHITTHTLLIWVLEPSKTPVLQLYAANCAETRLACWCHRLEIKNFHVHWLYFCLSKENIDFVQKELAAKFASCHSGLGKPFLDPALSHIHTGV